MTKKTDAKNINTLVIYGLTPHFLEKPAFWFEKNKANTIRARLTNSWWQRNTTVIEVGSQLKISEFLRALHDLGYEKVLSEIHKGTFKHIGSTIIILPTHNNTPISIDWDGNTIDSIENVPSDRIDTNLAEIIRPMKELDLKDGDYIVHQDHGIGIFREITISTNANLDVSHPSDGERGVIKIEYAPARKGSNPDTLLVPLSQKKKISQYVGFHTPKIHRLGTSVWQTTKRKTKEDLIKFARELISLYKKRDKETRTPYQPCESEGEIWDAFLHQETPDQIKATEKIFEDMSKDIPMDRILVGDVGFGKTEVALRAAVRAVLNGRQVAILTPTTILCDQHTELFRERFKNTPITIARYSRLETKYDAEKILHNTKNGSIDILIATHRLISKADAFKNLGLLIIDEEQRFGVRQKETLKKNYPNVDILSLSATPIPRTMYMCLSTIRSMSILSTPPINKASTKTFVLPFNKKLIKEAIQKEVGSGGQVYYLSNRIRTMPKTLEFLNEILPSVKKRVIHGRLNEKEIVKIMKDFRDKKIDVLISTTIIENGLDISNVNTLIVEDASRLGLAQAHQIRGRVGRGENQSFAYFLYNSRPTPKGRERLNTLLKYQELGDGIKIAREDLELRGAGNMLGPEQSGAINRVGWNLYFQLLGETIEEIQHQESLSF